MLILLENIENPEDFASKVYKKLLIEIIIERDVSAQGTCNMLLELPLVECSRCFINLNVSRKIFKPVNKNNEDGSQGKAKSFIDSYRSRPSSMETISLIDASKCWIYNKNRKKDNKWQRRQKFAIVRVYPRFVSIPPCVSDNFVNYFFLELLLYKPIP